LRPQQEHVVVSSVASSIASSSPASSVDPHDRPDRYRVSVEQYARFRRDGFVIVPQLISQDAIGELREHTEQLMQGRLPEQQQDLKTAHGHTLRIPPDLSPEERGQYFLRIHMLHRLLELHERYMLETRVLDVLEVLIGPDVLALQTMLFLKPPGKPGQGWHQDSYYIPTHPDTLCGAWIAIDDCDERNGAMWFAKGSGHEPVYPPASGYGYGDRLVKDITYIEGVSDVDDSKNSLSKVADRYDQALATMRAGDVAFFNGHVLHRSKENWSTDRFRRSFVSHYCNARSFTQWGPDDTPQLASMFPVRDPVSGMSNGSHILACGDTHLPFARPRLATACAAQLTPEHRRKQSEFAMAVMADIDDGMMGMEPADPARDHDDR
jgi:ectoine hydroxylase-related dioxygenase (phytanoyl-CoA dioxygenase family)